MYQQLIDEFVQREALPASYASDAQRCFLPLLQDIVAAIRASERRPFVVGINGAQGSGKSTLADLLSVLLSHDGFRVAKLSIDDFYFGRARRERLADEIHPLLRSRGVPGTHDTQHALRLMQELADAGSGDWVSLPGFDKSTDDCLPAAACARVEGPIDVVLLEGWFVGAGPQQEEELEEAINPLERNEDADGVWRGYVNRALAGDYQRLFEQLQMLILLQAPGFEQVLEWRSLQEEKLRLNSPAGASGLMDGAAIERFIQHFERLTRHCLRSLPAAADRVFRLDPQHRIHPD